MGTTRRKDSRLGAFLSVVFLATVFLAFLGLATTARAAECTDTWIGPSGGEWQLAENWSAEYVPTSEDVACIPKEESATITEGTNFVELLQGEGRLTITGGSLGLLGTGESSNLGILHLTGGALRGSNELFVTSTLTADGGSMEGAGETIVGSEASGRVEPVTEEGPGLRITEKRTLTVNGALTVAGEGGKLNVLEGAVLSVAGAGSLTVGGPEGEITVKESASLTNYGETTTNGPEGQTNLVEHGHMLNEGAFVLKAPEGGLVASEEAWIRNAGSLRMEGSEGEIRLEEALLENESALRIEASKGRLRGSKGARIENTGTLAVNGQEEGNGLVAGSGAVPVLLNEGTVRKDEGSGMAFVEFKTNNENLVKAESGGLTFAGGGGSGAEQKDKWVAEGQEAELNFSGALFTLGDVSEMRGPIYLLNSAIVKGHKIDGGQAEVWVPKGKLKITGADERSSFEGLALTVGEINVFKNAEVETDETFVGGGLLNIGEGGEGDLGAFFQGGGRTISRRSTTLASSSVYVEHGHFTMAADSLFEFGAYTQEPSTSVNIESGGHIEGSAASVQGGSLELHSGTEGVIGSFFQEHGTVAIGEGAGLGINSAFLDTGGGVFEVGTAATLSATNFYGDGITTNIGASAFMVSENATVESGVLKGSGTFTADNLSLGDATMSGSGTTIVTDFGSVYAESFADLEHRRLVTEGEFSLGDSTLVMGDGARLENRAEFDASSEAFGGAQIRVASESGTSPRIINKAEFSKSEGVGTTTVSVPFKNNGQVHQLSGMLDIKNRIGVPPSEKFGQRCNCGDPVETGSGDFSETQSDFAIGGRGVGLDLSRTYDAIAAATANSPGIFGLGWSNDFSDHLNFEEEEVVVEVEVEAEEEAEEPGEGESEESEEGEEEWEEIEEEPESEEEWEEIEAGEQEAWEEAEGQDWEEQVETVKRVTVVSSNGSTVPFIQNAEGQFEPPVWSQATLSGDPEAGYTYTDASQVKLDFSPSGALQSVTDRNGNETTLSYDEAGRLEAIADPAGRQITLSYDEEGLVESAEDPMGHVVHYSYEGGDLASVTMPGEESPRWQFGYDESHRMTSMVDGRGGETTNEYDGENRVVSQTDPAGRTLGFEYDGFHTRIANEATGAVADQWFNSNNEPFQITDGYDTGEASVEAFAYDEAGHLLERTDPNGHTTTYTYNPAGDRTSMTDAAEESTEWAYNGTHDVTSETTPRGETTTIARDEAGNPETISRPAPGEATQTTSFEYDAHGQVEAMTDPLGHTWRYEHDSQGDLVAETDPEGDTTTWGYDGDSRLTAKVSPRGNAEGAEAAEYTTSYERDSQGRPLKITDPLGHATEYGYDGNGNVKTETDANGHTTTYSYNADDELTEVEKPNGDTTETGYDGAGKVTSQTDGNGQTTEYVRDVLERPVEVIDPLGRTTNQEYDAVGNLAAKTDPEERTTTYSYDNVNRLTEVAYSDESTPDAEFSYDEDGNLASMNDGTGESSFEYDQLDRLTGAEDGHGDAVAYEYDLANKQTGITYPNGKSVSRTFDKAGRLASVGDWLGNTTSFAYDGDSSLASTSFPEGTGNVDEYDHDRADRISEITMRKGEETLAALGYSRDGAGQVEAQAAVGLPGPEAESFSYDENNRLVEAGSEAFEYDAADNMTEAPGTTNAYDGANQLEEGTDVEYGYDEEGERSKAVSPGGPPAFTRKLASRLSASAGLATDSEGNVWVADTGNDQVQEFSPEGKLIRHFGEEGSEDGQLSEPNAIAIGSGGEVYVADKGNWRIEEFTAEGEFVRTWGSPEESGYLLLPSGLDTDSEGDVWVLQPGIPAFNIKPRVQEFTAEGEFIAAHYIAEGAEEGQLDHPEGLAIDSSDDLWIADTENDRLERFSPEGEFLSAFGEEGSEAGQLSNPQGIAIDSEGHLWVTDAGNDRVQAFSSEGEYLSQFGESGTADGQFSEPRTLATDSEGNLWVVDTGNNRVQEISSEGQFLRKLASRFTAPHGLATDSEGNVWVADTGNDQVQEFSPGGKLIRHFGEEGSEDGQLSEPHAITIGSNGDVYVADVGNWRIEEFTPEGEFVRTWGSPKESGYLILPMDLTTDSEGDVWVVQRGIPAFNLKPRVQEFSAEGAFIAAYFFTEGAEEGQLDNPEGLAIDSSDHLWIADTENNRVEEFSPEGEFLSAFGEEGAGAGKLSNPQGIATDSEGNLWVVDTGNDRVQEFSSGGEYLTQFGESGTADGQFSEPRTLATDSEGNLWVVNTGNNRVQEWTRNSTSTSYTYDQAGNLTAVEQPEAPAIDETYAYDGTGLRASQTVSGATSHLTWDTSGGLPLLLDDGHASYIYGPGGLPVEQISEGTPTFYHHDQLGSTRMLTNASGEPTATFTYSAYGQPAGSTGAQTTSLGYAGQYTNEQSGLQYLRARVYDPVTGQFLTRDPMNTITRSPYSYAHDNPLNGSDPSGEFGISDITHAAGAIIDSFNPLKYYKEEVYAWENGASYWEAVSHGLVGACVLAGDASGVGALARGVAGRLGGETAALVDEALAGTSAGSNTGILVVNDAQQLETIYSRLAAAGRPVAGPSTYPGREVILQDGTRVGIRATSKSGGPAIDINPGNGSKITIHVK